MTDRIFLDTNLWIYLQDGSSGDKFQRVSDLIRDNAGTILISTQVVEWGRRRLILNSGKVVIRANIRNLT